MENSTDTSQSSPSTVRHIFDLTEAFERYMRFTETDDPDPVSSWKQGFWLACVSKHPMFKLSGMAINVAMARVEVLRDIQAAFPGLPETALKRGRLYGNHLAVVWHKEL